MSSSAEESAPRVGVISIVDTFSRHLLFIMLTSLVALGAGMLIGSAQPEAYTAESNLFFTSSAPYDAVGSGRDESNATRYLSQQSAIMTSGPLLTRALELGAPASGVDELREAIDVNVSIQADIATVSASAGSPETAVSRVENVIAAYREHQGNAVSEELAAVEGGGDDGDARTARLRAVAYGDGVGVVTSPAVTELPLATRGGTLLALVGFLGSLAIAFGRDNRSPSTSRTTQDAADGPGPTRA